MSCTYFSFETRSHNLGTYYILNELDAYEDSECIWWTWKGDRERNKSKEGGEEGTSEFIFTYVQVSWPRE